MEWKERASEEKRAIRWLVVKGERGLKMPTETQAEEESTDKPKLEHILLLLEPPVQGMRGIVYNTAQEKARIT